MQVAVIMAMHAAAATSTRAATLHRDRSKNSAAPHESAIAMPMEGMYVYRSARACRPTCTKPITGSNVIKNHSQPTSRYGRRRSRHAKTVIQARAAKAASGCQEGIDAGRG